MSKTQIVLIVATIILFAIGIWPIALITLGGIIAIALSKREDQKKAQAQEMENLKRRIDELEKGR